MARLSRDFFDRDTLTVSRELLGKYLCRRLESGELLALRLTETEAYIGRCDKACHAYGGRRTARTEPLFLPPGHAYIYLIYGMYHCLNLVTEPEGEPAAVLLRAGEAVLGRDSIRRFRFGDASRNSDFHLLQEKGGRLRHLFCLLCRFSGRSGHGSGRSAHAALLQKAGD